MFWLLKHSFDNQNILQTEPVQYTKQHMETTVGRVILNDHIPNEMPFVNGLLKKKGLTQLVQFSYLRLGREKTVGMIDELKDLGFNYATKAGISIGIDDMVVPAEKMRLVKGAQKEVMSVEQQYLDGAITHGERYNKIIEIWSKVTERVSDEMFTGMESADSLFPARAARDGRSPAWKKCCSPWRWAKSRPSRPSSSTTRVP